MLSSGIPSAVSLVQYEDALSEVLDLEMEEENHQTLEQKEKETESIKRAGDQIAKANIVKRENEFVQQSVEEVLQNIENVKKQQELQQRITQAQAEAQEKKKAEEAAAKKKPSDAINVELSDSDKYFFDGFTSYN